MTQAQYAICVTRNYYGPRTTKTRLIDNETGDEWRGTRAQARAMIDKLDAHAYHTAHNESGSPDYTIVRAQ